MDLLDCKTVVLFLKSVLQGAKHWPGRYFRAKHVGFTWACVSPQSHPPFSPSLQTFLLTARTRSRRSTCIIYGKTKGKSRHRLIWKQNIPAKQVYSRHKLVTSFTGMGERSIFKSCYRPTIRNVRGIVMLRALFDPIPVMVVSCLHNSCLVDLCSS